MLNMFLLTQKHKQIRRKQKYSPVKVFAKKSFSKIKVDHPLAEKCLVGSDSIKYVVYDHILTDQH